MQSTPESNQSHHYAWKQVSDGCWQRPSFGWETYFAFCNNLTSTNFGGRYQYIIASTVRISYESTIEVDVKDFKDAWTRVRFQQPQLAASIDTKDWTIHYQTPTSKDIDDWLSSTFVVYENTTAKELYSSLPPINSPSLYWLPSSNELIFRCPHWQIDGRGSWLFWDAFFTAYKEQKEAPQPLAWGREFTNLAPTMPEIWDLKQPTIELQSSSQALFMKWLGNLPGIGPAAMKPTPGVCRNLELEFDAERTSSIIDAVKKRGLTLTIAVHAAFAFANAQVTPKQTDGKIPSKYVSLVQLDQRERLGQIYTTSSKAVNPYFASLPLSVDTGSFDEMTSALKSSYDDAKGMDKELMCAYFDFVAAAAQSPEFLASPIPGDGVVSSLGVAEKFLNDSYGAIKTVDLHIAIDLVLGFGMVFLYTFGGKLRLSYCFNDGLQEPELVETILNSTKEILERELKIVKKPI